MHRARSASNLNALNLVVAAASVFDQVSSLVAFPPLSTASKILLGILQCIETLQDNKNRCARLASRCALFLRLIANNMQDRREVPEPLLSNLKKFERMLTRLKSDIESLAAGRLHQRLLRNKDIEDTLEEYNTMLDDALQSFHAVNLMEIQRTLGNLRAKVNRISTSPSSRKRLKDTSMPSTVVVNPAGVIVAGTRNTQGNQKSTHITPKKPITRSQSAELKGRARPHGTHTLSTQLRFGIQDRPYYEFTNSALYAIEYHGIVYPSSQHLYQARKFLDMDRELAEQINTIPNAKQTTEHETGFQSRQRHVWRITDRITVMEDVVLLKFTQHPKLRQLLLSTSDQTLVFDCPTDAFWGCGPDGQGRNELGNILTRTRKRYRAERAVLVRLCTEISRAAYYVYECSAYHSTQPLQVAPRMRRSLQTYLNENRVHLLSTDGTSRGPILFTADTECCRGLHPTSSHSVTYGGKMYPTAEHLYHAWKFFDTEFSELADNIRCQCTAAAAISVAAALQSKRRQDWSNVRLSVMETVLDAKFTQHPALYTLLLSTQDRLLIYNWTGHSIWGVGSDGKGKNELGQTLMRLRQRFRTQKK